MNSYDVAKDPFNQFIYWFSVNAIMRKISFHENLGNSKNSEAKCNKHFRGSWRVEIE